MKISSFDYRILILLIFISSQLLFAQGGWTIQTSGTSVDLTDVYFSDANNGSAVGGSPLTILRTTDGGNLWTTQFDNGTQLAFEGVYFSDANNGVVVGRNGLIYKTTDGGTNWELKPSGVTSSLWGLSFSDPNTGTAVGHIGRILRTTDGGDSWVDQPGAPQEGLNGVHFIDTNIGFAVGSGVGSLPGLILKTTDGGINWISQNSGTDLPIYDVFFTSAAAGIAVGGGGTTQGTILRTTDGGNSWVDVTPMAIPVLSGVHFINSSTGLAVGLLGTILRTLDGGATWGTDVSGTTAFLTDVFFVGNKAYAVGTDGTILVSQTATGINDDNTTLTSFTLSQNYPNPFNPTTKIKFSTSPFNPSPYQGEGNRERLITLKVYDILGNQITTLVNEQKSPGTYEVEFDSESGGNNLTSGIYFYKLQAGTQSQTKKMILLK
ncbi:MAG: T9SS type A sorting domain-containing protein [Ignavibacteriae bacterium]|nr:T9SS C-terminal target domain-containing protein [Ignavibacteriota bacterium]NOG99560.1 T9SS type A sorting domain-containing protein [Ignavibacteriota bacterium]